MEMDSGPAEETICVTVARIVATIGLCTQTCEVDITDTSDMYIILWFLKQAARYDEVLPSDHLLD